MKQSGHEMKKRIVIFDLDGTLAVIDKRRELSTKPNGKIDFDKLHDPSLFIGVGKQTKIILHLFKTSSMSLLHNLA